MSRPLALCLQLPPPQLPRVPMTSRHRLNPLVSHCQRLSVVLFALPAMWGSNVVFLIFLAVALHDVNLAQWS